MTRAAASAYSAPRTLAVNVPACLAGIAFAALIFNSLVGTMAALLFLAAGLAIVALQPRHAIDIVLGWWFVLMLPFYCLLSALWSHSPPATFRFSLQLTATIVIGLVIANRVGFRNLLRALFFALLAGTVVSLAMGRVSASGAWLGMFLSKNAFASHVGLQLLVSLAILTENSESRLLRLLALGVTVICLPLLILAQSAGLLVAIGPCIVVMMAVLVSRYFTGPQKLFLVGMFGVVALGMIAFAVIFADALLAELLDVTGKDATLTGRTDLWEIGLQLIGDNPWLGVGYRGFWVQGFAPAERLWALFYVPSGSGFNFHNTYISNAVEIGLIGLFIQVLLIYVPLFALVWLAVVRPDTPVAFLLALHLLLAIRSFIEVEVFFEFSLRTVLAIITFVYAARLFSSVRRDSVQTGPARKSMHRSLARPSVSHHGSVS